MYVKVEFLDSTKLKRLESFLFLKVTETHCENVVAIVNAQTYLGAEW